MQGSLNAITPPFLLFDLKWLVTIAHLVEIGNSQISLQGSMKKHFICFTEFNPGRICSSTVSLHAMQMGRKFISSQKCLPLSPNNSSEGFNKRADRTNLIYQIIEDHLNWGRQHQ